MKAWTRAYAIDANMILRFLLRDHPTQSPKAKAIMDAVQDGRLSVVCDPIQLAEVAWVLRSTYKLDPQHIADSLAPVVNLESFILPDKARYLHALALSASSTRGYGDACACATALDECDGKLFSFDKKLSRVEGISRVEDWPTTDN